MDVINPSANNQAIRSNWRLLHGLSVFLAVTATPVWFFTPFLTRHSTLRWLTIGYGMGCGTGLILTGVELAKLKPKITAMDKQEQADFKHSVASSLYLTQQTNQAIAEFLNFQRAESLYAQPEILEASPDGSFGSLSKVSEKPGQLADSEISEISEIAEKFQDAVLDAIDRGVKETDIIQQVMGYRGERYKLGRAALDLIKQESEYAD